MNMIPVKSSNIKEIGHEGNIMRVHYLNGGIYDFLKVSHDSFQDIMKSESKGKALRTLGIKGIKFDPKKEKE